MATQKEVEVDEDTCIECGHVHHEDYCIVKGTNNNAACTCEVLCGNTKCHRDEQCGTRKGQYFCECSICTCRMCKPKVACGCTKCECGKCVANAKCKCCTLQ
eukprot:TRINITY_DN3648_c0_g1_i1.p2 TRINITY_DN3648_c0_g1~~TRINITY_DN3648_c0_g1_i1.p2  ORF type:complete len:102 (-),score=10.52 TRINITY_DN3648_c0_g1_i1:251-556(-)